MNEKLTCRHLFSSGELVIELFEFLLSVLQIRLNTAILVVLSLILLIMDSGRLFIVLSHSFAYSKVMSLQSCNFSNHRP